MNERKGSLLKGVATITLMGLNLVFWVVPLMLVAVLKLLVPHRRVAGVDQPCTDRACGMLDRRQRRDLPG